ncbi:ABC transporter substrate-binding protein [Pelomonas sp. KK5]|uniref:substrate-binding periplasmic protein n=1 Tax=Pelomonas sp. KK5 TaxID=1855730 RepID=UPI00097BCB5F|nr:hypothetical protein [Pelomonas sp. KK5]
MLVAPVVALQMALAPAAPLTVLKLCVSGQPTTPEGIGVFHQRVLAAARPLDLDIEHYAAPRARCLQDTRTGKADALIGVFSPDRQTWLAYPTRNGQLSPDLAVGNIQIRIYRRVGTKVDWDGRNLTGLDGQPLGLKFGSSYGTGLAGLGVPLDERAMTNEQLVAKLIRGRVGAVLLTDEAIQLVSALPSGQIESLPRPYGTMQLYLAVNRDFERTHSDLVQALWASLAEKPERSRR